MVGLRALAAILALTLSASPVVLDRCLIACEAGAGRKAPSATAAASCHSSAGASSAASVLAPHPACGHDHLSSSAVLVAATHQVERPSLVAIAAAPAGSRAVVDHRAPGSHAPPGAPPPFFHIIPLRV